MPRGYAPASAARRTQGSPGPRQPAPIRRNGGTRIRGLKTGWVRILDRASRRSVGICRTRWRAAQQFHRHHRHDGQEHRQGDQGHAGQHPHGDRQPVKSRTGRFPVAVGRALVRVGSLREGTGCGLRDSGGMPICALLRPGLSGCVRRICRLHAPFLARVPKPSSAPRSYSQDSMA